MSGLTRSGLLVVVATASLASSAWAQTPRQVYDHHFTEGNKFQAAGRPAEALPHYQAAAEASGQIPGGVERVDRLFYNLGMALSAVGRKEESLKAMKDVEDWRRKNLGASDPETIRVIHFIGGEYMNLLDFAKAEPYVREELALTEARFKADSLETAEAVLAYAALCAHQGKREEQWKAAQRALNIREARLGPKSYLLRPPLQMLASQLVHRGEYTEAEALHRRIAGLDPDQSKNPSIAGFRRGDQLLHLGNFYKRTGRMAEAEAMYREMIEVYAQLAKLKIANAQMLGAQGLAVMGDLYLDMGLPDKAETYYRASLEVHEQIPPTPVRTFPLQGLGKVLHLRGELDQAMEYMTQAAEAGKNYRGSALAEADAAALFCDLGNYPAAAEFFAMAAEKLSKTMGEKSPHFIKVRLSQAELEVLQGKPAVAEKLYRQVLEGARAAGGVSPDGADAHLGLAQLARAAGQRQAAIGAADHARREMRRYTRKMLPALGESEQLEFLANREATSLRESMALALEFREDALVRETAAGWVVNSKGLVQEAIAERTLLARGAGDEKVAAVLREWLAIRYRMARLSVAGSGSTGRDQEAELAALSAREQRLASQLGRTSTAEQPEPWVEIAAVRKAIPKDAVLIEIVRFTPPVKKAAAKAETPEGEHERKAEEKKEKKPAPPAPDNSRYLAWVIPPAGDREVQIVDLGRAVEMEETIAAARKLLVAAREEIAEAGEADAEAALKKELAKVTKLLLEPLLPHLGGSKHWILSPDGALWLVPWSALPMKDGTYLVETVVTQFVVSGRDLVEQRGQKASGNAPLVLADPDFDGKDGGAGTTGGTRGIDAEDPQTRGQRSSAVRSAVSTAWQRLPGTAREAKDLEPKLAAYTGSKIEVFTGPAAAEQVFRDAWQPRVAVLSTHGYFLEQPQGAEASPAMKSPLVRCGLVLAGANRRAQGAVSGDDGILTGLEIVGADLRGTELVVLSACETGLGEVRSAEGVVGLRQAFQLAGAQSVLASLWRVPDADTAHLMTSFYEKLAATGDKAGALRQAQLALLERHRKESRSAHPYYWAAFTLTGRSDRPEVAPAQPRPVRPVVRAKVQVVSPTAPVMDGPQQVATARQGEAYEVAGEQGDWLLITVPGRAKPGWILKRHVRGE